MRAASQEALSVLLVGAGGFLVDAAVLMFALSVLPLGLIGARVVSFLAAVTFTWQLNRRFTFRSVQPRHSDRYLRYLLVSLGGFAVNFAVYSLGVVHSQLLHSYPLLALLAASSVGLAFNFIGYKTFVFGQRGR